MWFCARRTVSIPSIPPSLYSSFGFVPTNWMDPQWKEEAEKARVGKPRRLLLVKPLRPGVAPPPVAPIYSPAAAAGAPADAAAGAAAAALGGAAAEEGGSG